MAKVDNNKAEAKNKKEKSLLKKNVAKTSEKPKKEKITAKNKAEKTKTKAKPSKNASKAKAPSKPRGIKFLGGLLLSKMARGGAAELRDKADEVNKLNVFPVPDGDTGDNMSLTIESGVAAIENLETDNLADAVKVFSRGMLLGARGNSGVILSQFFAGVAKGLDGVKRADPKTFGEALELGVKQAYTSVMTPTEGTILTVARESVEYAVKRINSESTIRTLFADLVEEMHSSLDRTPEILKVLKEADVVDSGAAGLFYIMDGFNRVLNGEKIKNKNATQKKEAPKAAHTESSFGPDSEMTYGYCTELLVQLQNKKTDIEAFDIEALKAFLGGIGDSVVAFKTESIVKVHVHTFTPEKVIAHLRQFGEFITVKIENMSLQHTESFEKADAQPEKEAVVTPEAPKKKNAVVSVSIGDGIKELFLELGADVIIHGGQTQNPSTNDFLEAFEKINAENIFVFPNNSNIVMAAEQAGQIYTKAKVYVIPSKNIGMGYAALSSADIFSDDTESIVSDMTAAMKRVSSAYVSPAVRDTEMNGLNISVGDTIGIMDKEIVVDAPDVHTASVALAVKLLDLPEKFMLTVFCGKETNEEQNEALKSAISEVKPDAEIYFINGGQEIYPYIFLAE